jgi:spermidine synthase
MPFGPILPEKLKQHGNILLVIVTNRCAMLKLALTLAWSCARAAKRNKEGHTTMSQPGTRAQAHGRRHAMERAAYVLPLLILFSASGCAALIYEIVWFQRLQLAIGSSAISLGVLLGAFMGGMCLGSLLYPRFVSAKQHPLRVYAYLEMAIGGLGVASLIVVPLATRFYSQFASTGNSDLLMRATISMICLLPPTILMGATLPAIARWMKPTPSGASRLGLFYGANIAGAVFGCLLAGFYLLRLYDLATATYVAVAINFSAGLIGWLLSKVLPYCPTQLPVQQSTERENQRNRASTSPLREWPAYLAISLSGVCALGAEVIWTRQLSLVLGPTVYSFSIILAVFLAGLGLGSTFGAVLTRQLKNPGRALAWAQLLAAGSIAWASFMLAKSIPYWPFLAELATSPWHVFPMDVIRAACAVLPGAIVWGASFPIALATVAGRERDTGRLVGRIYAANTIGAIVGAIGFSVFFVGWIGMQSGQRALVGVAGLAAALMIIASMRSTKPRPNTDKKMPWVLNAIVFTCFAAATAVFAWSVPDTPAELIGFGHRLPYFRYHERIGNDPVPDFIYVAEGMNASIAVSTRHDGYRGFHVNGKAVASNGLLDMRLQRMLGHWPSLIHGEPKSILVVGCGTGVTAGTFTCYPSVKRIVICEIEPLIQTAASKYFAEANHRVMDDPRVEVNFDDARHFVFATNEKFDIITSDPIHPWVKGAASLYSREYFELCKKRLAPGGIVTQWVPLYETNLETVKSGIATFCAAFPHVTVWCNQLEPRGLAGDVPSGGIAHDIMLLGQVDATKIDIAALADRMASNRKVHAALDELDLADPNILLSTFVGRGTELEPWLAGAQINKDANLRLQFLAGIAVSEHASPDIFASMIKHRTYPDDLFLGTIEGSNEGSNEGSDGDSDGESLLRELREIVEEIKRSRSN